MESILVWIIVGIAGAMLIRNICRQIQSGGCGGCGNGCKSCSSKGCGAVHHSSDVQGSKERGL